jgi:hypothetical protein
MKMGMMEQILSSGVEHGEESDRRAEVFGIGRNRLQGVGRDSEEQAIDHLLILICDAVDRFRYGKDDMEVLAVEKLSLAIFYPIRAGQGLALWAMAIAAAVVEHAPVFAPIALFEMAAESGGATQLDRTHDAPLSRRERRPIHFTIGAAVAAQYVSHFQL